MSTRAINHNFELYNRLIEEKEFDDLEQFMNTTHTVAEVEEYTNCLLYTSDAADES